MSRTDPRRVQQRRSRLPALSEDSGRKIADIAREAFHPDFPQPSEDEVMFIRRSHILVPPPHAWTMAHPGFSQARDSALDADIQLLANSKMGRELALARAGKMPGGWTEDEVNLFWMCELRYPYIADRHKIQAALPREKIQAFRKELDRRRNNARKRKENPPPLVIDSESGSAVFADPLRADLPLVAVLMITFWTWRPLWLADSDSIATFLERHRRHLLRREHRWLTRKGFGGSGPTDRVNAEHVNKVVSRYGLYRHSGPGKVRLDGHRFVPNADLERLVPDYLKQQGDRLAAARIQREAIRGEDLQRAIGDEIIYIQTLGEGGYSVM